MSREKSLARSKKTTAKLADFLVREGAASAIPGGGLFYDAAKILFNHGKAYFFDRTESRIEDFHSALLTGKASEDEYSDFINKEFDLDDYYAVLSSCVHDIENEKVPIYSQLMSGLINSKLSQETRCHFIQTCKELTYFDLCFLKDLYINSKHDLMSVGGTPEQVRSILSTDDPFRRIAIEKLAACGFIDTAGRSITKPAETLVATIFPSDSLTPESIGRKPFSGLNVLIVSYQLSNKLHSSIASRVQEALWASQIKSSIHVLDEHRLLNSVLFYGAAVLIVDDKPINPRHIESLLKFSEKRPIFRLNIDEHSESNSIGALTFAGELTLESTEPHHVATQVAAYISTVIA